MKLFPKKSPTFTIYDPNFQRKIFNTNMFPFLLLQTNPYYLYPRWNSGVIVGFSRLVKSPQNILNFPIQNALSFYDQKLCDVYKVFELKQENVFMWKVLILHLYKCTAECAAFCNNVIRKGKNLIFHPYAACSTESNERFLASSTTLRNNQQHDDDRPKCCLYAF